MDRRIFLCKIKSAQTGTLKVCTSSRMAFCATDGNQGFPISITGPLTASDQAFQAIKGPAEIIPSFSQRTVPRKFLNQSVQETGSTQRNLIDENSSNTLMYRGTRYSLVQVQICRIVGGEWPGTPAGTNLADAVFVFSRLGKDLNPDSIFLTVPLYSKESMSNIAIQSPKAQMYFEDTYNATVPRADVATLKPRVSSIGDLFGELASPAYVSYISCIPLRSNTNAMTTTKILGAYFPAGWILPDKLIKNCGNYNYNNSFAPLFIPASIRNGFPTALRIPPPTPAEQWIGDIDNWSAYGRTYSNSISVSNTQFSKLFVWIAAGLTQGSLAADPNTARLKTTIEYQCVPLDRMKDIDGNYVLLDPKTGARTLKETLTGTPDQKIELALATNLDSQNIFKTFATILGVIAAVISLIWGISELVGRLLKRADMAPMPEPESATVPSVSDP